MTVNFVAANFCHDAGIAYADVQNHELHVIELDKLTGMSHYGYTTRQPDWPFSRLNSIYRYSTVKATVCRVWLTAIKLLGIHANEWLLSPLRDDLDRLDIDGLKDHQQANEFLNTLTDDGLRLVDHQLAHAYTVAVGNKMTTGTVITLDGVGDGCGGTFTVHDNGFVTLKQRRMTFSLGELYERLTSFFVCDGGQSLGREGTFMAYAGLGKPTIPMASQWARICNILTTTKPWAGLAVYDQVNAVLAELVEQYDRLDVAATCHKLWVDAAEAYIVEHANVNKPLGFAGGSALNCALNARLARRWGKLVHWTAMPGDCGQPLGMVYTELMQRGINPAGWTVRTMPVLDPEHVPSTGVHADPEVVAKLLATGHVIAVVRGEVEAGPRALGRRSILASPLVATHKERLNDIKGREAFRPFGVMIQRERLRDFTDLDVDVPWMNVTVEANEKQLPAAVHTDGTTRVQTVTAGVDPWTHAVLEAFGQLTGVYAVINTSLNTHGHAIFNRVMDAQTLLGHGVDALVVDDRLIKT